MVVKSQAVAKWHSSFSSDSAQTSSVASATGADHLQKDWRGELRSLKFRILTSSIEKR